MGGLQLVNVMVLWFITITGLATFAFVYGGMHATNPNFQVWVLGMMVVNVACVFRLVSVIVNARITGKI